MRTAILALSIFLFTGCGLGKTMDATQSMPPKLDETNTEVKKTNAGMDTMIGEVKKTNDGMGQMIGEVKKTNKNMDDMAKEVKKTNDGMDNMNKEVKRTNEGMGSMIGEVRRTNEGMERTNKGIHKQTLAMALAEMMKPDNTQYLSPPMGMIPGGDAFAAEATAAEIVELTYVFLKDIDSVQPTDTDKDEQGQWKREVVERVDHSKLVKFTAAMIIAGRAPQETIEDMIKEQISGGGRYEETAYAVLMLRYLFIHDFLLQESLFSKPLSNIGKIQEAMTHADRLSFISGLPFAEQIQIKTLGMLNPANNIAATLDREQCKGVWARIDRAFDMDLGSKYKDDASLAHRLVEMRERVKSQMAR